MEINYIISKEGNYNYFNLKNIKIILEYNNKYNFIYYYNNIKYYAYIYNICDSYIINIFGNAKFSYKSNNFNDLLNNIIKYHETH